MESLNGDQSAPSQRRPPGWDPQRVFLSHAARDKARFVDELFRKLSFEGLDVWYDSSELLGGDIQDKKILDEDLPSCGVFVVVLTKNSIGSAYVAQEIAVADGCRRDLHCTIIPVVVDGVPVPRSLRPTTYIRVANTDSFETEFERLVRSIRAASRRLESGLSDMSSHISLELPLPPEQFINREKELAALDGVMQETRAHSQPRAAVLAGLPGAGKSALAAQWVRSVRDEFDDPALTVDFAPRGRSVVPDVNDVVGGLVRRLGGPEAVPANPSEVIPAYRRLTDDKRLLLLVENISQLAQLEQVMPHGRGSLVVATTTTLFDPGSERHITPLPVGELEPFDAAVMLRTLAGRREGDEPQEDWEELAHACGCLPVALAVCGVRLRDRRTWSVRYLIEDLQDVKAPISLLIGDVSGGPTRVLERTYRDFDVELQRFYRRLGAFSGATLTAPTAAALAGASPSIAGRLLEDLLAHRLLIEDAPRRYRIHPIVQEHMRSAFARLESSRSSEECVSALLDWYLGAVRRIDRALAPERLRIDADDDLMARDDIPQPATTAEANDWYLAERQNVIPIVEDAADLGMHRQVWRIAEALWLPHSNMRLFADWITCSRLGAVAAHESGNAAAEARLRSHLARAYAGQDDHERAQVEMATATACLEATTHPLLAASITEFWGTCALFANDLRRARKYLARARRQMSRLGNARGVAIANLHLARTHNARQAHRRARRAAESAIRGFEQIGDGVNVAKARMSRAVALVSLKGSRSVLAELRSTIDALAREGLRFDEAQLHELAHKTLRGDHAEAHGHVQRAYQIYRELGHADAERLEPRVLPRDAEL